MTAAVIALHKRFPDYRIIFAGHSMGGALAEIHAAHFYRQINCTRLPGTCSDGQKDMAGVAERMELHTYGCPRVFNKIMARCVTPIRRNRVVNKADPVPFICPKTVGYRHPPREVWLTPPYGEAFVCSDSGEDGSCHVKHPWNLAHWKDHQQYFGLDLFSQEY
eukprot:JZ549032.1.p1 GENE.JZ549032.1~~JZ549032.1.p1  ORF type:complete len:181 (+),score=27.93 JZ549032.1:56-544(+)